MGMEFSSNRSACPQEDFGSDQGFHWAVLGSATVQIFNTATGLLVDTVTSDSAGNYFASDPNAVNCFAVAYEAGSPDVAGTTKNNLTGT